MAYVSKSKLTKKEIYAMHKAGKAYGEIAEAAGVTKARIGQIIHEVEHHTVKHDNPKHKAKKPAKPVYKCDKPNSGTSVPNAFIPVLLAMRVDGKTYSEIAEETNLTYLTVYNAINANKKASKKMNEERKRLLSMAGTMANLNAELDRITAERKNIIREANNGVTNGYITKEEAGRIILPEV